MDPTRADLDAFITLPTLRLFDSRNSLDMSAGSSAILAFFLLVEQPVHEGNRDGALTHRGRDPFDVAASDVTYREDPRQTGEANAPRPNHLATDRGPS
jgi:hypothetical protein